MLWPQMPKGSLGISDGLMHLPMKPKNNLEHLDMMGMARDDHRHQYVKRWAENSLLKSDLSAGDPNKRNDLNSK